MKSEFGHVKDGEWIYYKKNETTESLEYVQPSYWKIMVSGSYPEKSSKEEYENAVRNSKNKKI